MRTFLGERAFGHVSGKILSSSSCLPYRCQHHECFVRHRRFAACCGINPAAACTVFCLYGLQLQPSEQLQVLWLQGSRTSRWCEVGAVAT
ncbi:hypothetical protein Zm00014a_039768 [Zea mays]|uniref:Uncharacterized protein n=1 Tax=Zea mays TaxID=4577 RepID=A0A3L6D7V0_MAIZE|nr:hypothetical protein Zm00014a_039768 [Zea mays]